MASRVELFDILSWKIRGTWNLSLVTRYDKISGFLDLILYDSSDNWDFFYFEFDEKMSSFEKYLT